MPIIANTRSLLLHRTVITGCDGLRDGGRQRLLEAHDLIHSPEVKQTGRLVVDYSQGTINSIIFEESERVPQEQVEKLWANGNGFAHKTIEGT